MASLQEIELELQSINDATFQQLCDEFLFFAEDDYPRLNRHGSQKGKRKTKKGTPDTFWKNFDEEKAINIFSNIFNDSSILNGCNYYATFKSS